MRRLILLVALAAMTLPAMAAKSVTVVQLEKALTAATAAHKRDAELVRLIGGIELTERLTETSLGRLGAHLVPGSKAALALQLLADQSVFLDPPASELPAIAAQDNDAQRKTLEAMRSYVAQTLPHLPNFLATRTINRYDDSPQAVTSGSWPVRAGLHLVDTSSREVSVFDERENRPPVQGAAIRQGQVGLISGGEFSATLGMIMEDTAQGTLTWSHWEETADGTYAVFKYSVPKSASHYEVVSSVQRQAALEGHPVLTGGSRGVSSFGMTPSAAGASNPSIVHAKPGYHGSIWLDPATGTILRITIVAEPKDLSAFKQADIMVQYGAIELGSKEFICPVRSLALSVAAVAPDPAGDAPGEELNETLFTGYQRFASTTRILTDTPAPK
jgi:hypothetical protein